VAVALGGLPKLDAALARGELSYCKVRAMTRVADADNEELLLAQARGTTGAELERVCSGFRKVMGGPPAVEDQHENGGHSDGSRNVSAEAPNMADAAAAMAERTLADTADQDNSGADRRLLFIHLAERRLAETTDETASEPWNAALQDGTTIHSESLLRLACDCGLVVTKTDAKPGRQGRRAGVLGSGRNGHPSHCAGAGLAFTRRCGATARGAWTSGSRTHDAASRAGLECGPTRMHGCAVQATPRLNLAPLAPAG